MIQCIRSSGWTGYMLVKVRHDLPEVGFVKIQPQDFNKVRPLRPWWAPGPSAPPWGAPGPGGPQSRLLRPGGLRVRPLRPGLYRSVWKPLLGGGGYVTNPGHELLFIHHQRSLTHHIDFHTTQTVTDHSKTAFPIIHCTNTAVRTDHAHS